jgi:hypothetical protein
MVENDRDNRKSTQAINFAAVFHHNSYRRLVKMSNDAEINGTTRRS